MTIKFTLEIELGNEAMSNASDVAEALEVAGRQIIRTVDVMASLNEGVIKDRNGNRVGAWGFDHVA